MFKNILATLFLAIFLGTGCKKETQDPDKWPVTSKGNLLEYIAQIEAEPDSAVKNTMVNTLWDTLLSQNKIPWISNDTIIFLYKSKVTSLQIAGDMTGWGQDPAYIASNAANTSLHYLVKTFPLDARLDYKFIVNNSLWTLDGANKKRQLSGFGPNSAFSMPQYDSSEYIIEDILANKGNLSDYQIINSSNLGHNVRYWVYTPYNYQNLSNLKTIYVTDGQEYKAKGMGSMVIALDNLIHKRLIEPVIAIFVDPVRPDNSQNMRAQYFLSNSAYALFFKNELVPYIDANYKTNTLAQNRAILGTSYGGHNAAWFGYKIPETFQLIASQSPAYQPDMIPFWQNNNINISKFFLSTGVIFDTESKANQMETILKQKQINYQYIKVNEGHSWGNWAALLDNVLIYFFPYTK